MSSSYVWVQLYYKGKDEPEGQRILIKTASLDPPFIAALAEAVKDKMAEELTHCSAAKLVVFPPNSSGDREKQYDPDKEMKEVIAELEKKKFSPTSAKHPLLVVAPAPKKEPQQTPPTSPSSEKISPDIIDLLKECKGKPLTTSEIDYALNEFHQYVKELRNASNERHKKQIAHILWVRLSTRIRTRTRLVLMKQHYLFDGPVPGATTGLGTEIQFVLKGSSLFCAKIMQNVEALRREYNTAVTIHTGQSCPTVMPTIDFIEIPGETARAAMITPYYPLALAVTDNGHLSLEGSITAALCGIATLKAFSVKNFCHGDIKPSNMMFCISAKTVVTIDFGSACPYGESLTSITPQFGLDCPLKASLAYELTCLATSLFILSTGESPPDTIEQLKANIASKMQDKIHPTLQVAQLCLVSQMDIDGIWKDARGIVDKYLSHLDPELLVHYNDIWPVAY